MSEQIKQLRVPAGSDAKPAATTRRPRLGFLGVGWIGRNRLRAIADADVADIVAVADPDTALRTHTLALAPDAATCESLEALLDLELDGVVIATPSALHAGQAEAALAKGVAVFCQKPLARTAAEAQKVIAAARRSNRLLGVDLSYRHTSAMRGIRAAVREGEIGDVYAIDLVFHNAYGPDKAWFRDPKLSGGGCVIDLGTHLVDLALWTLGAWEVSDVAAQLFAGGRRLGPRPEVVEDHAIVQFNLHSGPDGFVAVRLACSWNLSVGRDAVIEAHFHGTRGGLAMRNVGGSFLDFVAERFDGTRSTVLAAPPDDWGGRAALEWVRRLAGGEGFDPEIRSVGEVARVLDAVYGR